MIIFKQKHKPEPWEVVDEAPYVSARGRLLGTGLSSLLESSSDESTNLNNITLWNNYTFIKINL